MNEDIGLIDIHSHILPGVDDGAKNMAESLEALQAAYDQGIRRMFLTPHWTPERAVSSDRLRQVFHQLQAEAKRNEIPIALRLGQECMYCSELPSALEQGKALTMGDTPYVLVEFFPDDSFNRILYGLSELQNMGYLPILAHYERYYTLRNGNRLQQLKERGINLQVNFDSLKHRFLHSNPLHQDFLSGIPDFVATDCHGVSFRPIQIAKTYAWMQKHLPSQELSRILLENPNKIWSFKTEQENG